jgi:hypothetical protein
MANLLCLKQVVAYRFPLSRVRLWQGHPQPLPKQPSMRKPTIISAFILTAALHACDDKVQKTAIKQSSSPSKSQIAAKAPLIVYESPLRPDKQLTLGKIYVDTVSYSAIDDNGDNTLFIVQKNDIRTGLISNQEQNSFSAKEQIEIRWKMDSIRNAGDSEFLDYREFLLTARKISVRFPKTGFNGMKNRSIVVSCGTGCAMTYNPREIKQINPTTISVTFDIEMHMDGHSTETFSETYLFNKDHTIETIGADGKAEYLTKNISESALWSFQEFGKELLTQIK